VSDETPDSINQHAKKGGSWAKNRDARGRGPSGPATTKFKSSFARTGDEWLVKKLGGQPRGGSPTYERQVRERERQSWY
jgi:hypothetical protein